MKAFILAAGLGTRLSKYTKYVPKPCLKVFNKYSIISKLFRDLDKFNFIDSYIINIHYKPHKIVEEIYNTTDKIQDEIKIKRAILSGTDIPNDSTKSKDGRQQTTLTTLGNGQMLFISGLPS